MRRHQVIHEVETRQAIGMEIHRGHVGERDELEARRLQRAAGRDDVLARHDDRRRHGGVRRGKRHVRRAGHRRRDRGNDLFSGHAMRTFGV